MRAWAFMSSVTQVILAYDVLLAVLDNKTLSCLNLLAKDIVDAAVLNRSCLYILDACSVAHAWLFLNRSDREVCACDVEACYLYILNLAFNLDNVSLAWVELESSAVRTFALTPYCARSCSSLHYCAVVSCSSEDELLACLNLA